MTMPAQPLPQDRRAYARARWAALGDRLATITPGAIGRTVLSLSVIGATAALTIATWPALAPFAAGAILAYAVLPLANRLDRVMPRVLAAIVAEATALVIVIGVAVVIVPPLVQGVVQAAQALPPPGRVQASLDELEASLGTLQEPVRSIALQVATGVTSNLEAVLDGAVDGLSGFVTNQILGIVGTASFLLGLLVIPVWILTLVRDEGAIKRRAAQVVTPAIRPDVIALVRIVDRALSTFLRIRVLLAILTGTFVWLGFQIAQTLGIADFRYAVAAAVLLGALQLIPDVGTFLGLLVVLLAGLVSGPAQGATGFVVLLASTRLAGMVVEPRVAKGVLDVHPALMIPGIVVLSQFGLFWLLAAAPLLAISRDTVRYLAGRFADPPAPANVLPGERPRPAAIAAAAPVPSAYRDAARRRQPVRRAAPIAAGVVAAPVAVVAGVAAAIERRAAQ